MFNVLFCMNLYPGIGGVESVTSTLIDYLGMDDINIFVASFAQREGSVPLNVRKSYSFSGLESDRQKLLYNEIVHENEITHVIVQGMYPHLTELVFNEGRHEGVKIISVLHGVPMYEAREVDLIYDFYKKDSRKWNFFRRTGLDKLMLIPKKRRYLENYKRTYRTAAAQGDCIVLLAEGYIDQMCESYSLEEYRHKMMVIPNCLPGTWSDLEPISCEDKENIVLYVGRLSKEKGVDKILKMWSLLEHKEGWRLLIVGDGPCRGGLMKEADILGLENVHFEGFRLNTEDYYRKAKLSVLTSDFEGFGMTLIESQCFSTVPVSYESGDGVRSVLEDGGGVLVRKDDMDQLVYEMDRLMSDEDYYNKLSCSSKANAVRWTVETVGEKWKNLIKNI